MAELEAEVQALHVAMAKSDASRAELHEARDAACAEAEALSGQAAQASDPVADRKD